jgi:tetratricopeptide (TPR) repeat protein
MLLAALALAQASAEVSPPTAPVALQAQFDQANAAFEAKQWQQVLDGFTAIEARKGVSLRSIGIARLREGIALANLHREDEAREVLGSGLALTSRDDAAITEFRASAALALGELARQQFDTIGARRAFDLVLNETTDPSYSMVALLSLADVTMFDDPPAALGYATEATKIADAKASKEIAAQMHDARGRALLNRGDLPGAIAELRIALKDAGGVTNKTTTSDVRIRSDLAIALLLAKQEVEARQLMAMTGAGRMPDKIFAQASQMELTPCSDSLHPDDVAVIEFSVGNDGFVREAHPVYASRPGMPVLDMARTVSGWAWRPSDIAKVEPFYRTASRIELRCSKAVQRPESSTLLWEDVARWFTERGAQPIDVYDANRIERVPLADLQKAIESAAAQPRLLLPLLMQLAGHPQAEYTVRGAALRRALDVARAEQAPAAVLAWLRVMALQKVDKAQPELLREADMAPYASDPRARAVLILTAYDVKGAGSDPQTIKAIETVGSDDRLDPHDPLRVGAMVRISAIQAKAGNLDAARQTYLATGLNAQQCALVDARPAMRQSGLGPSDYPYDAVMQGVSGWTQVEFDITADGKTANRRAILSYPPFTFGEAAANGMRDARYTQSYRPDGGLGCGGASMRVSFVRPNG